MISFRARAACTFAAAFLCLAAPAFAVQDRSQSRAPRAASEEAFNLAFVDADVRRVVDAVLGSMLEVDYSIDPAVQGNITLRTRQPVTRTALIPLLENALRSVGAVLVMEGSAYRVVPREGARARAPLAAGEGAAAAGPGFATELVTLRSGSAEEVARLVRQFLGDEVVVGADGARSQLLIAGTAEERQAARALIERFDVDMLGGMQFELFRLENVDAETVSNELTRIFQPPFDIVGSRVRLVPLPRLRALLAIALTRADIERIEPWVRRLDAGASGKRRLFSYSVQNGRARDLARAMQLVLGSGDGAASSATPVPIVPPPAPLASQSAAAPGGAGAGPRGARLPAPAPRESGDDPSIAQSGIGGAAPGPRIVPSEENNSLLIYATGEEYEFIREALERLDQPVPQVLIEATLAEVTLTDDLRYGVSFSGTSGDFTAVNSNAASGIPSSVFPGFSLSVIGSTARAVLNSLQARTQVRVLSAPKLIVLNNQTATLQVGDQVPIVTQQAQSVAAPGAPIVNTIELRDTGVILNVTPRVNDSGTVILDITQEVSDVTETTTSGINSPTIQQRRISSSVATRSGQMIALGGLIREASSRRRSGIPGLSQIPVIGGLFGTHGTSGGRTELIILLTPTVIRAPQDVRGVVDAVIDGLDRTRPLVDRALESQASGRVPQP
jgi:general secretion pathway protein D